MRIIRYSHNGEVSFGVVQGAAGTAQDDLEIAAVAGHPFGELAPTGARHRVGEVTVLPPVLPTKVVCIGKNYADHIAEMGGGTPPAPVIFLKPTTALAAHGDPIALPVGSGRVDHEAELAVVIGRVSKDVPPSAALAHVLGYTCANDVSDRDEQQVDGQWARAKGHDTYCPLGPWIETDLDPGDLAIRATVDGEVRQDARTSLLLHDVPTLIAYVSKAMTLLPGDLLLTGTPAGVGPIRAGQRVEVSIEGIGTLANPVVGR